MSEQNRDRSRKLDRRTALQLGLAIGGLAGLGQISGAKDHESDLHREIEEVLHKTAEIWNSQDSIRLREVWDTDDPEPWYVPEEIREPFFSWSQLDSYWDRPGSLKAFRWKFSNLHVKSLAPDLALALFDHFYELEVAARGPMPGLPPMAGFDRVITLFRKKPEGWRHILYAQCPLGPESYIRALREKIVSPDFGEFSNSR
jgi:hypothetical protein